MTEIRLGTMGWSYDFWVGTLYPHTTIPQDYLSEYAKIFNAVEINSTFYRIPRPSTPPNFEPDKSRVAELKDFITQLPRKHLFTVEFRHQRWFTETVYSLLRDHEIALTLVDRHRFPKLRVITSHFIYLRWQGNRRTVNGELGRVELNRRQELLAWARIINPFLENSLDVYGFFSKYYSGYPPSDIRHLTEHLSTKPTL